jgi:SAM-dependent methyltransferase
VSEEYSRQRLLVRATELVPQPLKSAIAQLAIVHARKRRSSRVFYFRGREYEYFFHPYNLAWRNERTVELPIALQMLEDCSGETLEVGNVLPHYVDIQHDVLDKYEVARGVINEDASSYRPDKRYALILSMSTLEHMGWDEHPRDIDKPALAVANLSSLLAPGGTLVATLPVGQNPELERLIERGEISFTELYALRRVSRNNDWEEADYESVKGLCYSNRSYRAKAIIVGLIREGQVEGASDPHAR